MTETAEGTAATMIQPSRRSPWKNCANNIVSPEPTTKDIRNARTIAPRCSLSLSPRNRRLIRENDIITASENMEMSEFVTPGMTSGKPPKATANTNAEASMTVLLARSRRTFTTVQRLSRFTGCGDLCLDAKSHRCSSSGSGQIRSTAKPHAFVHGGVSDFRE